MSEDIVWGVVKKNSCFLRKRNGFQFSMDPHNVMKYNSHKYSGVAREPCIGIDGAERGVVLKMKSSCRRHPKKALVATPSKYNFRRTAKNVSKMADDVRPDLKASALRRSYLIYKSQKRKNVPVKKIKVRGRKH